MLFVYAAVPLMLIRRAAVFAFLALTCFTLLRRCRLPPCYYADAGLMICHYFILL
jgi:hypothetical protein